MPDPLRQIRQPMAATQVARPFHREGWVYEEKYERPGGDRLQGQGLDVTHEPEPPGPYQAVRVAMEVHGLMTASVSLRPCETLPA